jgi:hypothetical protein
MDALSIPLCRAFFVHNREINKHIPPSCPTPGPPKRQEHLILLINVVRLSIQPYIASDSPSL